jgi:chromosome segregation ATPase
MYFFMSDFLQLELEDLRIKEEELKQIIKSHAPDNNEISTVKKRIIELESKLYTEKEMLLRKEVEFKTYELASLEAKSVIEVLSEDKDSLCNQVKTISASLEFLRSSCKSAKAVVNEYQQKLKDAEDEGALRDYLITILRKKEERAKIVEDRIKNTVSQIEEVENDLNKINEDLQKKETVHREMLVQLKQVKSELMELRDIHACTEKENKAAQSQMKSLKEANNQERQQKYFELKSQLVEIQEKIESMVFKQLLGIKYDAIRKELDTERESLSQLLSL